MAHVVVAVARIGTSLRHMPIIEILMYYQQFRIDLLWIIGVAEPGIFFNRCESE